LLKNNFLMFLYRENTERSHLLHSRPFARNHSHVECAVSALWRGAIMAEDDVGGVVSVDEVALAGEGLVPKMRL
jgi:hypothetical protein